MKKIENSPKGEPRFQFAGELLSPLSETTLQNSNGKNYKVVTIEFENAKKVKTTASAAIYEGNYSKGELVIGEKYLCTATIATNADGKKIPYIQMSHLVAGAGYAELSDFNMEVEETPTDEFVGAGEIKN